MVGGDYECIYTYIYIYMHYFQDKGKAIGNGQRVGLTGAGERSLDHTNGRYSTEAIVTSFHGGLCHRGLGPLANNEADSLS